MSDESDLDDAIQQHQRLRRAMPNAWNAFFARFGSLRAVQLAAIPPVLSGKNTLITAPTAGGKTEAVVAPLCQRLAHNAWPGLSVLIVTPTRALVNDLFNRIGRACGDMGIRLGRKTADHALESDNPSQILITTPESTESMLTFRREILSNLRAIIVDEIHLLDGSPRGDQLRCLLSRLSAYRQHVSSASSLGIQRVAMSATVSDPLRLAKTYLGSDATVITVPGQRQIQANIVLTPGDDQTRAEAAIKAADQFPDVKKILVFVNSRKQVDLGTSHFQFGRFSRVPVYGHHGSLSKVERENVEGRFKSEAQAICVATTTLEVGIDIGDIDLVICMDPPFSLSSFLQRIGRGCRRLEGLTRVLCIARDRASELMFRALIRQSAMGLPPTPLAPFRRSVIVQQALAYLKQVNKNLRIREQFERVFASEADPPISTDLIGDVLEDMVRTGLLDRKGEVYQPATLGRNFIESDKVYGNIQSNPSELPVVDVDSGQVVATVAGISGKSTGIRLAGRSFSIVPGGAGWELRVRGGGDHAGSHMYHARKLPYRCDIGASLAGMFQIPKNVIMVIHAGQTTSVFTWLGSLLNAALANTWARQGLKVHAGSFHLAIASTTELDVLSLLRQAVQTLEAHNPLGLMKVERMVDVGPHFALLSNELKRAAQEDWLSCEFLKRWLEQVNETRVPAVDSAMFHDLSALTLR